MAAGRNAKQLNKELKSMRGSGTRDTGSAVKKTGTAKTQTRPKKAAVQTAPVQKVHRSSWGPVSSITVGVIAGLLLELCMLQVFGTFGGWIRYGLFGMFGSMAYLFPVLTALLIAFSGMKEQKGRRIFFSLFLFILLCTFAHLVSSFSLNNRNVLSYFTACAEKGSGGGILGGAIALGLYILLSKTGAVVIDILLILLCIFFLFEDPIKALFSYIFSRDYEEEEDDYEEEFEEEPVIKRSGGRAARAEIPGKRAAGKSRSYNDYEEYEDFDSKELEDYDERYIKRVDDYRRRTRNSSAKQTSRMLYDDPVMITENADETVIRIVKRKQPKTQDHQIPLTRASRKAQPLRDPNPSTERSSRKAKGISREVDMKPQNANGDEIHEITRRAPASSQKVKTKGREFFDETLIKPAEDEPFNQLEWNVDPKEATVTSVSQAAVNVRAKAQRPVKVRNPEAAEKTPPASASQAPARKEVIREKAYNAPPMELLARVKQKSRSSEAELEKIAENLELILEQFGVHATVTDIQAGPSVTRFELQPELGTRVNRITSLADDLKLNLGVTEIRIEAPIPGRQAVGIEIPNKNRQTVFMRELLEEPSLVNHPSRIAFAAGKDISGNVVVADIAKMPHLLVAGTTGSGKSVFLNTILMTILYRSSPAEVGLIIVDPKKVEFGIYAGIPHLMKDVVTDPSQAVSTLRWAVSEMTNRYQRMQLSSVRDFKSYNAKVEKGTVSSKEENPRKMNQIVIIIDELADLMMVAKKEAESLICRLAQLARAAGIHLIIATQRPSVDVVTGLIKANVPARVALLVSSQIDSRTIIDMPGAEKLLGNGDMLFYPTGYQKPVRIQGAFVSDDEIQQTVDYLIRNNSKDYFSAEAMEIEKFMNAQGDEDSGSSGKESDNASSYDEFFYEAGKLCIEMGKASSSMLQRRFNLGFNRAARIIDQLQEFGAVGPQQGAKPREILVDQMQFEEMYRAMKES